MRLNFVGPTSNIVTVTLTPMYVLVFVLVPVG
jgi:hypothetical protein